VFWHPLPLLGRWGEGVVGAGNGSPQQPRARVQGVREVRRQEPTMKKLQVNLTILAFGLNLTILAFGTS